MSTDPTTTEAWRSGVADAVAAMAAMPPDDGTTTVSLDRHRTGEDRPYFKLCRTCHHPREAGGCHCQPVAR